MSKTYSPLQSPITITFEQYSDLLDETEIEKVTSLGLEKYYSEMPIDSTASYEILYNFYRMKITATYIAFPNKEYTKLLLECLYNLETS